MDINTFKNLIIAQLEVLQFVESEELLPYTQEPATGHCPVPRLRLRLQSLPPKFPPRLSYPP